MDKSLLRKAAFQSIALMIAVITFSYTLNHYQTVTIRAIGKSVTPQTGKFTTLDNDADSEIGKNDASTLALAADQKITEGSDQSVTAKLGDQYLIIRKPEGNNLSLKLKDIYINKSIKLTITGITTPNLTSETISRVKGDEVFNGDPKFTETVTEKENTNGTKEQVIEKNYGNDPCQQISITASQDNQTKQYTEEILIQLDRVYAYITYEDSDYYYIDLKRPSDVYDKILVVDAGHGGKDCGAISRNENYYEKNMNLSILLELKKLLDKEDIKVYYTRTGDDTVYLRPRVELANDVDCDYFISIHCNANTLSYPNGTEVLFYNKKFKGVKSSELAKLFSKQIDKKITLVNKGTVQKHKDDIYIMKKSTVPMILIEVGYLTNNNDMNYLSKTANKKLIAQGIYNGIMKAYSELPVN